MFFFLMKFYNHEPQAVVEKHGYYLWEQLTVGVDKCLVICSSLYDQDLNIYLKLKQQTMNTIKLNF